MKALYILCLISCLEAVLSAAELRTYRQVLDVTTNSTGTSKASKDPGNLFEMTFLVDLEKKIITRKFFRRLDEDEDQYRESETAYRIIGTNQTMPSDDGPAELGLVAVGVAGASSYEMIQMGEDTLFSMRTSPFSQVITGVFQRVE